jgi:two-component system, OmpR family, phosphate regulon sensor histidine kinase PhoR
LTQKRHSVTIALMCSSMLLLLILQFFWLRGAYGDAAEDFRKETNALFRNTIFSMHDSLIQRSMLPVGDTLLPKMVIRKKGLKFDERATRGVLDSTSTYINITDKTARIEIFTTEKNDSIIKSIGPLVSRMQMAKEPRSFVFRLDIDSLSMDSIRFYYSKALDKAEIDAEFKIIKTKGPRRFVEELQARKKEMFVSEPVPFSPMTQYTVVFAGAPVLVWKEMTPQLLFSLFLTLLTGVSFMAMYKNLRAQQRLMEIKNDFISNVTHELKTPVATVSVALEALKSFNALDDPKRTREYLDIAQRELTRLTLMTDKILKTSVYEDQGVTIQYAPLRLDVLVDQVLSSMKLVFEKKRTEVECIKEGEDFSMSGSEEHLTNVLYNLLDNGEDSRIEVSIQASEQKMLLKIKDSGIGIASEFQRKIFEKFFRVPSGDVHNIKGYGLGLSYVNSVVASHGGSISVESEPGKGSCFIIELPRHQQK